MKTASKLKRSFFYFEKIEIWEKWIIGVYFLFTLLICLCYAWCSAEVKQDTLILYIIGPQLSFYLFLYKSLRNFKFYLFWFLAGIIHFVVYLLVTGDYYKQMSDHKELAPLEFRNTIILLIFFQLLRWTSIKLQRKEFVMISRTGKDLFDEREYTFVDFLLFAMYMAAFVGLCITI